jgi:hypothetical protein
MYKFELSALAASELSAFFDVLPLNAVGDVKTLRLVSNGAKDLQDQNKEFGELFADIQKRQSEFLKPHQEEIEALKKTVKPEDESKESFEARLAMLVQIKVADINGLLKEKFADDNKTYEEAREKRVALSLSDDKFDKLKEIFEAKALEVFQNKKVLVEIVEGLDAAVKE